MIKLVHFITSLEMGGAQAVLYDLVTHLNPTQFEHHIIFIHDGPYRNQFQNAGITLHYLSGSIATYDPSILYRLIKLLKEIKTDCLHTVLWSANWLGRIATWQLGISCVTSLHNNYDQNGTVRTLLDRCAPSPRHCIAVSQEVKSAYQLKNHTNTPITVIPNGIDIEAIRQKIFSKKISREMLGFTAQNIIIGSVGRFQPVKRYGLLLETFSLLYAQNQNLRLVLVGSGPEEHHLRKKAKTLGIAQLIHFATDQRAYGYYPMFDIFVLSSEKEGVSIALLEAMGYGIAPVITYHSLHHPVIQHGYNGYVACTNNATGFAQSINTVINNPSLCTKMGSDAQKSIQSSFGIQKMIVAYEKIFQHTQIQ